MPLLLAKRGGQRDHRRYAGGIVIRPVVHAPDLILPRERAAVIAVAEMIVVRANGNPGLVDPRRRTVRRQVAHNVPVGLLLALDDGAERHRDPRDVEAGHVRIGIVERLLGLLEGLPFQRAEDRVRHPAADAGGHDARPRQRGVEAHRHHVAGIR